MTIRAPFPWFGGKSRVAALVWQRFGNVPNFVESFAGSLAVLLGRPHEPRIETVNDLDCYISNFWRALQADPEGVAHWADWPVNEADLHARHWWLVRQAGFRERMHEEADYYDSQVAGWWVWGICQWIGGGWCAVWNEGDPRPPGRTADGKTERRRPALMKGGRGVHRLSQQRPILSNAGIGVHRPSQQISHLGSNGHYGNGIHAKDFGNHLYEYMYALAQRLRRVRVCCGDFERVLGPTPTFKQGLTGVFLDPPYSSKYRDGDLYAVDSLSVAQRAAAWCLEEIEEYTRADGPRTFKGPRYLHPKLRIALCGYEGDYEMPADWDCVAWKAAGGYGSQGNGNDNPHRERIWFSPHCLQPAAMPEQLILEACDV